MRKLFTSLILLVSFTSMKAQLSEGDIAFTAMNADGDDDIAFVALVDIPANTNIYFTDNEWTGTSFNNLNEGELTWSHTSLVPAGTVIVIEGSVPTTTLGSISGSSFNIGASNETVYALLSAPSTSTMSTPGFLAGISNDLAGSGATLSGTGLTAGTDFIDFANDQDGFEYTGARTGEASFSAYLPLIMNTANWQQESSNGENIIPIDASSFTTASASTDTEIDFSTSSATVFETAGTYDLILSITNEDGSNATTCDVALTSGSAADVNTYATTQVTFPAGSSANQTVTLTITDDATNEGEETLTFTIQNAAGGNNATVGSNSTFDLTIDDDDDNASLPFSEAFAAAGVPTGWTFTDFTVEATSNAGGSANEAELNFSNDNPGTSAILSPYINTTGETQLELSWNQNLDYFEGGSGNDYVIKVQSTTDGNNWNDVYTKTVSADETGSENVVLDAADGVGNAFFALRWLFFSNGNRFSYWRIDDISLETYAVPSITAADNSQPGAANMSQGALDHILSAFSTAISDNDVELNTLNITINGTFDADDIDNFQLFYASSNSFGSATQLGSDIAGNGNGVSQALSFSGLTQSISDATTGYFWVVADVSASATAGNTLTAQTPTFSFAAGNLTNNVNAAGAQTIVAATPRAVLADNGTQVSAANVNQNVTNHLLASFQLSISDANADFNGVDVTTAGTYAASDVENLKLWYSTDNSFDAGADSELDNIASPATAGAQSFSGYNQILTNGSTGYFFVTVDFPCEAVDGNTINISALENSDLSFNGSTNASGTATASGSQTIQDITPAEVTGLSAGAGTGEVTVSWTNPACFTEVIVVAHTATISGTPTGTYSANSQDFTDGTNPNFPTAGKVVYNGTGTSTTITGLTNSTQYFFKVFARKGSNWNSGVEDDATPSSGLAVFVNEMSQGSGGSKEWIEIVVTENGTDLRGWDIGDNDDGSYTEFVEFSNSSDWSNLNAGTVIAIYNGADVDGTITPDSDFSDNEVTIASNNATYFTGSWGSFGNSDGDDLAAIRDDNNSIIHDMAVTHGTSTISGPGSGQVTYYTGSSSTTASLHDDNNWTTATSTSGTPGSPNGGANSTWIQGLRPAAGATPNPSSVSISGLAATSFDITWTKPSGTFGTDWDGVLVFVSDGSNGIDLSASGEDGVDYTANLVYTSGTFATDAGANDNAYCVANQTTDADGSITVTGLTTNTTYYVYAFAYEEVTGNNDDDNFSSQVSGGSATPANLPSAGDIVITEIMYNSSNSGSDDEWVEIYNNSGSNVSMNGSWRLTYDANTFDFGEFTFNDGAYYTIALGSGGDGTFNSGSSFTPDTNTLNVLNSAVANTNSSNFLTNSTDPITIVYDPSGSNITIDAVTYDDGAPWPTAADGGGPSLTLIDPASDNSLAASWRASFGTGGTPGADTLTALTYDAGAWNATDVPNANTGGLDATVKTGQSVSISSNGAIDNLTIESTATLTIAAGNVLTVNGDVTNNNSMVIESAATLLQTKSTDGNSGTGTYSVTREFTPYNQARFSMWSSPVSDEDIEDAFSGSNSNDFYEFDADNQQYSAYASGVMNAGQGYAVTPTLNSNVNFSDSKTFEGSINNGDVSLNVTGLTASDYVLLGNPYPGSLDFAAFAADHSDILPTAYYWDATSPSTGDAQFVSWNASGATSAPNSQRNSPSSSTRAMQGFFVQVDPSYSGAGSINFVFQNDMRQSSGNTNAGFFKTETRERAWFNLSTDSAANQILVMLDDRATNGFDRMFDAPIYKGSQYHSFYSMQDSMELSIQGVPYVVPGTAKFIPLGVDAWYQGVYTISLDSLNNWDANNTIILIDSTAGVQTDLSQGDYQFAVSQTGIIHNRLYLLLGAQNSVSLQESAIERFFVFQNAKSDLVVSDESNLGFTEIEIRDMRGQLIVQADLDAQNVMHHLSTGMMTTGVYMVRLRDRDLQEYNVKVMIKK